MLSFLMKFSFQRHCLSLYPRCVYVCTLYYKCLFIDKSSSYCQIYTNRKRWHPRDEWVMAKKWKIKVKSHSITFRFWRKSMSSILPLNERSKAKYIQGDRRRTIEKKWERLDMFYQRKNASFINGKSAFCKCVRMYVNTFSNWMRHEKWQ